MVMSSKFLIECSLCEFHRRDCPKQTYTERYGTKDEDTKCKKPYSDNLPYMSFCHFPACADRLDSIHILIHDEILKQVKPCSYIDSRYDEQAKADTY